jgi:hypothetical protein
MFSTEGGEDKARFLERLGGGETSDLRTRLRELTESTDDASRLSTRLCGGGGGDV